MEEQKLATGGIVSSDHLRPIGDKSIETIIPLDSAALLKRTSESIVKAMEGVRIITYNTNTVKGRIIELLNEQTKKGLNKYGHTLDDCPDEKFDWKVMAMEEMADCIQYLVKENMRLERLLNP